MNAIKNAIIILFIIICLFAAFKLNNMNIFLKENNEIINERIYLSQTNNSKNTKEDEEKKENQENKYKDYQNCKDYKLENLQRYLNYKEKNNTLKYCNIVTYVNIGLDKDFYTDIIKTDLSYDNLIITNKYNKLDETYIPNDLEDINSDYFIYGNTNVRKLTKEAKEAFEKLSKDAIANGTPVYGQSAYRDYKTQNDLYNYYVSTNGKEIADKESARPGHSEHQTGLAIDVSSTKDGNMLEFENTPSFTWLQENAHKYGFILRYPKDKTNITGYIYEPWHYRYVGIKTATDIYNNYKDLTYEEYFYKYIEK